METGKRKLEDMAARAELKERVEALQKMSKVEFDEWGKTARPLLDGGEGKIGHGGPRRVVIGIEHNKRGGNGGGNQATRRERCGSGISRAEMA